ncbi:hypothetical protein ACFWDI_04090 [Streptomyces sp. NPDC060064]|uniref:hypothetical protein n=1 Tax=Streptomyces sp. NPDC060064 TaxID=3347049 RepID=UPI0036CE20E6
MSLFRLDASILPATSTSAELADLVEAEWSAARPGEPVVRRSHQPPRPPTATLTVSRSTA